MKTIMIIVVVISTAIFNKCTNPSDEYFNNSNIIYTVDIPVKEIRDQRLGLFQEKVIQDIPCLCYFSKRDNKVLFRSIVENQMIDSLSMGTIVLPENGEYFEYISFDSVIRLNLRRELYIISSDSISSSIIPIKNDYLFRLMNYTFSPMRYN